MKIKLFISPEKIPVRETRVWLDNFPIVASLRQDTIFSVEVELDLEKYELVRHDGGLYSIFGKRVC